MFKDIFKSNIDKVTYFKKNYQEKKREIDNAFDVLNNSFDEVKRRYEKYLPKLQELISIMMRDIRDKYEYLKYPGTYKSFIDVENLLMIIFKTGNYWNAWLLFLQAMPVGFKFDSLTVDDRHYLNRFNTDDKLVTIHWSQVPNIYYAIENFVDCFNSEYKRLKDLYENS